MRETLDYLGMGAGPNHVFYRPYHLTSLETPISVARAAICGEHSIISGERPTAEVVAVALHFGTEYVTAPDAYQVGVVEEITRSPDIDLVYGHHAHTVQPLDRVHGTWVAYGLGNFVAQQGTSPTHTYRGVSLRFELTRRPGDRFEVSDVAYLPTMITPYNPADPRMRVLDVPAELRDGSTSRHLRESLAATLAAVRSDLLSLGADNQDDVAVHLLRQ